MSLKDFQDREYRQEYARALVADRIAVQIKVLREARGLTQQKLAQLSGTRQSRISALESGDYDSWNIKTLHNLAEAFDTALSLRFVSFGELLEENADLSIAKLSKPAFADDTYFLEGPRSTAGLPPLLPGWRYTTPQIAILGAPTSSTGEAATARPPVPTATNAAVGGR